MHAKQLITQNIDGLDSKAGNTDYISIHGRINEMTLFHEQGEPVNRIIAPWDQVDETQLTKSLLDLFKIGKHGPKLNESLKPYVLLFDEFYTELYQINKAQQQMLQAEKIVFIGTSFSVNITQMAIETARQYDIPIEVIDPEPCHILHSNVTYHKMTACEYISKFS